MGRHERTIVYIWNLSTSPCREPRSATSESGRDSRSRPSSPSVQALGVLAMPAADSSQTDSRLSENTRGVGMRRICRDGIERENAECPFPPREALTSCPAERLPPNGIGRGANDGIDVRRAISFPPDRNGAAARRRTRPSGRFSQRRTPGDAVQRVALP